LVERVGQGGPHLARQVRVNLGSTRAAVTEVVLDDPQVNPGFEQVGGIGMSESVYVRPLHDATAFQRRPERTLQTAASNRAAVVGEAVL